MSLLRGGRIIALRTSNKGATVTRNAAALRDVSTVTSNHNNQLLNVNKIHCEARRTKIWTSPFPPFEVSRTNMHTRLMKSIDQQIAADPNRVALISAENPDMKMKYTELKAQSNSVAAYLNSIGFSRGDVAALMLPNCFPFVSFYLGVTACDGAISGANPLYTEFELQRQLVDSNSSIVITHETMLARVLPAVKNSPNIRKVICVRCTENPLPEGVIDWKEVASFKGTVPVPKADADDVLVMPYSSGTTGNPKGVMLTHASFGACIDILIHHYERTMIPKLFPDIEWVWHKEYQLLQLPMYHVFGFSLLNYSLLTGSPGVVFSQFDPIGFLKAIETYKCKHLMLVPPLMLMMTKHPAAAKFDLSSFRFVIVGSAPTGKELCEEFLEKYKGVMLSQGFGMSELGCASHLPACEDYKAYASCGIPAANCQMKIVDDDGQELEALEKGEICVKSPAMMKGYLNNEKATHETIIDGWLHSGDIGYANEKGELYIVDRKKELIKVKALQVAPAELEDVLVRSRDIADAAVIGIPHERFGEVPKAFIVKARPELTEQDVKKYIEERLAEHKWLVGGVEFVETIPKALSGKILRRVLRDMEKAKGNGAAK